MAAANETGGRDNISVLLVHATEENPGAVCCPECWENSAVIEIFKYTTGVGHAENDHFPGWCCPQGSPVDQRPDHSGPQALQRHRHRQPGGQRRACRFAMSGSEGYIEDLNSTNGTYVNGKAVKKQLLQNNDIVEIGKYKIQYVSEVQQPDSARSAPSRDLLNAAIRVLSGAAAGREMPWSKR